MRKSPIVMRPARIECPPTSIMTTPTTPTITPANALVADCVPLSATRTVKLAVPVAVGVPLTTPALDKVRPAGRLPTVTDHVYGGVPPVAARVCEYAVPTVPLGSGEVVVTQTGPNSFTYEFKNGTVQIPGSSADAAIKKQLAAQGAPNAVVNCPSTIIVKVGTTFTCPVSSANGKSAAPLAGIDGEVIGTMYAE